MSNLDKYLWLVRDGRIDYAEFVNRTRKEFRAMACYLMRRWTTPEWVTPEDVEQELYLGAWEYVWKYEEAYGKKKGTALSRYVVFNSMTAAKRTMHKARGAALSGSPDRAPSRFEKPLSHIAEGDVLAIFLLQEDAEQENGILQREERDAGLKKALNACKNPNERLAILCIAEAESIEDAGKVLYDNTNARITLRLNNEEEAERYVWNRSCNVVERMGVNIFE